jgi:hypothetical protein
MKNYFHSNLTRLILAQLLSPSGLALKYEYELNCQEKIRKIIPPKGVISLRHSSILRRIRLNFMALCLIFIQRRFQFSHFYLGMLPGRFIILQKLALSCFLQDMLLDMCFWVFLYVTIAVQRVSSLNKPYIYITSLVHLSLNGSQLIDGII